MRARLPPVMAATSSEAHVREGTEQTVFRLRSRIELEGCIGLCPFPLAWLNPVTEL